MAARHWGSKEDEVEFEFYDNNRVKIEWWTSPCFDSELHEIRLRTTAHMGKRSLQHIYTFQPNIHYAVGWEPLILSGLDALLGEDGENYFLCYSDFEVFLYLAFQELWQTECPISEEQCSKEFSDTIIAVNAQELKEIARRLKMNFITRENFDEIDDLELWLESALVIKIDPFP